MEIAVHLGKFSKLSHKIADPHPTQTISWSILRHKFSGLEVDGSIPQNPSVIKNVIN